MKEFIKIKVQDVLELFSILDRDITELNNTNKSISDNRDYSYSLKKALPMKLRNYNPSKILYWNWKLIFLNQFTQETSQKKRALKI